MRIAPAEGRYNAVYIAAVKQDFTTSQSINIELFNENSCRISMNKEGIFGSEYIGTGYVNPISQEVMK